jgi:hypothetical protein
MTTTSIPLSVEEVLNKNVDIDTDLDKDLLLRQSKLLYPELDEWVLNMAIEAYLNSKKNCEDMKDGEGVSSPYDEGVEAPMRQLKGGVND